MNVPVSEKSDATSEKGKRSRDRCAFAKRYQTAPILATWRARFQVGNGEQCAESSIITGRQGRKLPLLPSADPHHGRHVFHNTNTTHKVWNIGIAVSALRACAGISRLSLSEPSEKGH